jgi:putative PEP-CTERM system integral membrane protein
VGPRHYRLRAFPIPVRIPGWVDRKRLNNPNGPTEMNLWLTYKVMRSDRGWALPQLGEKRNVFWSRDTDRQINGKSVGNTEVWYETEWLPRSVPAQAKSQAQIHKLNLGGQLVTANPLTDRDYAQPTNQRIAIVLDSSRSMEFRRGELALTQLQAQGFTDANPDNNDADLFVVGPTSQTRIDDLSQFKADQVTFYGSIRLDQLLQEFAKLRGTTVYDSVLVVTDGDTYELSKDKAAIADPKLPLWMVHLDKLPPAYDDGVLKLLQNGGGVSTSIGEVLQRSATETKLGAATRVADGYAWSVVAAAPAGTATEAKDPFAPLAARQLIRSMSKSATSVEQLDAIHAIAKQQSIVTPYSSMIVLVNDEQRRQLAEAEASVDRFKRKVESGQETLDKPSNILGDNTSVPDPSSTVALLCGGGLMLIWQRGKRFARHSESRDRRRTQPTKTYNG